MSASSRGSVGRRRLAYGLVAALVSGVSGVAVHTAVAWSLQADYDHLIYFVLPQWVLILCAHLFSGITAIIGLILLVPPLIRNIQRDWVRPLTSVAMGIAITAASVPWLIYFLSIGLNSIAADFIKVTADNGESLVVERNGFDLRSYSVFSQESSVLYQRITDGRSTSLVFQPDTCILESKASDLLLTCGEDHITLPSSNR